MGRGGAKLIFASSLVDRSRITFSMQYDVKPIKFSESFQHFKRIYLHLTYYTENILISSYSHKKMYNIDVIYTYR